MFWGIYGDRMGADVLDRTPVTPPRLLIAASGTGGHVFPAIATAERLPDYEIEWLGVPDRMEGQLIGDRYPFHAVRVGGFQGKPGLGTVKILWRFAKAIVQTRRILKQGKFDGVFTTGGYISAPAIVAAKSLGLPAILHESNALPGKVTRLLAPWCSAVAVGFEASKTHLSKCQPICTGTPARQQFLEQRDQPMDLPIPPEVPLIAIVGGSQGAVAINRMVRACAPAWFASGAWVLHQTGENDPEVEDLQHPHYVKVPFYQNMAGLFKRADLVISRSGAGTLTELAMMHTPSILIPYPFAAEDHQAFNAKVFASAEAAIMLRQNEMTEESFGEAVLGLLGDRDRLKRMADNAGRLAVLDSAEQLTAIVRRCLEN
jgi:UDP-N-acetylglucosamine--N-acetylmuramyl-(pentapeptide) pyrophosphoryl-undecaprenol N-acetylglucosamine transferase